MVKKTFLGLAVVATAIGMAGCKTGSVDGNNKVDQTAVTAGAKAGRGTAPLFNLGIRQLPLANDLLFAFPRNADGSAKDPGDADGTFYNATGKEQEPLEANGVRNPNYNPVFDAINDLDGVSVLAPMHIEFDGALAATPAQNSVYLVPLNYSDNNPKRGKLEETSPFNAARVGKIKLESIAYSNGSQGSNVLRISPLEPLMANTRYLLIVTSGLKDSKGASVEMPRQYRYLTGNGPLLQDKLVAVRTRAQSWYKLAQGFVTKGLKAKPDIVRLAYTFTTGGASTVLNVMAAPGKAEASLSNKSIPAAVQHYLATTTDNATTQLTKVTAMAGGDSAKAQKLLGGYKLLKNLPAPAPRLTSFKNSASQPLSLLVPNATATFRTGTIDLPTYSPVPQGVTKEDKAANPKPLAYNCADENIACSKARLSATRIVIGEWEADKDVIYNLLKAKGVADADAAKKKAPSENVTNLFPFASQQGTVTAQVLVVEPTKDASGNACARPATGWPVVIYQHGFSSDRMSGVILAEQLAKACMATVAIDLPLHGVLPDKNYKQPISSTETKDVPWLALINASQNSSQSMSAFLQAEDPTRKQIIGSQTLAQRHFGLTADQSGKPAPMSTKGVTSKSGSLFVTFLRFQKTRDNIRQAVMDLMNLNASIPFMDIDADGNTQGTVPDFDKSKIYFAGTSLGSVIGMQFVAVNNAAAADTSGNSALNRIQAAAFGMPGGGLAKMLESSTVLSSRLVDPVVSKFKLTKGDATYESLMYVYQSTLDSADPAVFAAQLNATQTPFTLIESTGDKVVPNKAVNAPLSGTDPLIALTQAKTVDTTTIGSAPLPRRMAVKLTDDKSNHLSMVLPDTDANTVETEATFGVIAKHIISLFSNPAAPVLNDGGAGIVKPVSGQ